ncbi:Protein T13C2.6 a [Aphelenchoides avenae]|nr:Protein T13C2.6 a [Aphelenchus avenae]
MLRSSTLLLIAGLNGFLSAAPHDGGPACGSDVPPAVIYATQTETNKGLASAIHYNYNGSDRTLISMDGGIAALDYSREGKVVAWSDNERSRVHICRVSEAETPLAGIAHCNATLNEFVAYERGFIHGIAVDWVDLRTNQQRVLIDEDVLFPQAIAVDPSLGVIFWTDLGIRPERRVERSGMDGSQRVRFPAHYGPTGQISFTNGLALDMAERRVYWLEKEFPRGIYSTDYNGADFRLVLRSAQMGRPYSLAITVDWLLWTERGDRWRSAGVWAYSTCSNETVQLAKVAVRTTKPMTVRIFDPSTQPRSQNVCEANACGCDDFCLPTSRLEVGDGGTDGEQRPAHLYVCLTKNGTRVLPAQPAQEADGRSAQLHVCLTKNGTRLLPGPPAQATQLGAWTAISTLLIVLLLLAAIALLVWGTPASLQQRITSLPYSLLRPDAGSSHFELGERVNRL